MSAAWHQQQGFFIVARIQRSRVIDCVYDKTLSTNFSSVNFPNGNE